MKSTITGLTLVITLSTLIIFYNSEPFQYDLILEVDHIIFPDTTDPNGECGQVFIHDGKIVKINQGFMDEKARDQAAVFRRIHQDSVLMPGLIDSHVHVNEPGREDWETFKSATRAAAKGGATTIIDMPLNSIPVLTTSEAVQMAIDIAEGNVYIDVGFWGGVIPANSNELKNIALKHGVFGFKAFMCPSGIDEFPKSDEKVLENAIRVLGELNLPLLVHAEYKDIPFPQPGSESGVIRNYMEYLATKPPRLEAEAIKTIVSILEENPQGSVHVVHLSDAKSGRMIKEAAKSGLSITAETCPHYLTFEAEKIPDGDTLYKVAPPIRESANREVLWDALQDDTISFIASDHSPSAIDLKLLDTGDFEKAWGGIGGVQLRLPLTWTEAKKRKISLIKVTKWLSENPASWLGLKNKGKIQVGNDADFVIWNPEEKFLVTEETLENKVKTTPFTGMEFYGVTVETILRGKTIYTQDEGFSPKAQGQLLFKNQ